MRFVLSLLFLFFVMVYGLTGTETFAAVRVQDPGNRGSDLSSPEAVLRSFMAALNGSDLKSAARLRGRRKSCKRCGLVREHDETRQVDVHRDKLPCRDQRRRRSCPGKYKPSLRYSARPPDSPCQCGDSEAAPRGHGVENRT